MFFTSAHGATFSLEQETGTGLVHIVAYSSVPSNTFSVALRVPDSYSVGTLFTNHSLIRLWIESPLWDPKNNTLTFSGIVPNGTLGTTTLLSFSVQKKKGVGSTREPFYFLKETMIRENNSKGTLLPVIYKPFVYVENKSTESIVDTVPPVFDEAREIRLGLQTYAISMQAHDAETGIQHFEIQRQNIFGKSGWEVTQNPHSIGFSWFSNYRLRATDYSGNTTEVAVPDIHTPSPLFFFGILVCMILLFAKYKKKLWIFVLLFFIPFFSHAATLHFSPTKVSLDVGESKTISVFVESDIVANAVSGIVNFPPDDVSVTSITKANSVVSMWVKEPQPDNETGMIPFEGVILNPGFSGSQGTLFQVTLKAKKTGNFNISFLSGSVLANDGKATNILSDKETLALSVSAQKEVVLGIPAPEIISDTHPSEDAETAETKARFLWNVPLGVTRVRLLYNNKKEGVPRVVYNPAISEKTLDALPSGEYWFHAQFGNESGWGPIAHRRFIINTDFVAPTPIQEIVEPVPTIEVEEKKSEPVADTVVPDEIFIGLASILSLSGLFIGTGLLLALTVIVLIYLVYGVRTFRKRLLTQITHTQVIVYKDLERLRASAEKIISLLEEGKKIRPLSLEEKTTLATLKRDIARTERDFLKREIELKTQVVGKRDKKKRGGV